MSSSLNAECRAIHRERYHGYGVHTRISRSCDGYMGNSMFDELKDDERYEIVLFFVSSTAQETDVESMETRVPGIFFCCRFYGLSRIGRIGRDDRLHFFHELIS